MSSLAECLEKLDSEDETERAYAAEDLSYLNSTEGVAALLKRLPEDPSQLVRDAILQALVRFDGDEPVRGSIVLLMSDDPQVRNLAVSVLRHKLNRALPFLEEVMLEGDGDMRKFVLDVLRDMPDEGTERIYRAALADRDTNVVITAVENIGKGRVVGWREDVERILVGSEHPMLDAACLETLAVIGNSASLETVKTRFPDPDELRAFLLIPYFKVLEALAVVNR